MSSNKKRAQNHIDKMKVELISNIISACTKPITKNLLFFVFMYILGLFISTVEGTICTRLCLELFIELYLYCTCLALLPPSLSHTLRIISYILLYLLSLIEIWFYLNMDTTISPTLLQLAIQTNINESSEAINSYLSFKSIKLPIIFIVIIIITNIISSYFCHHLNDFFSKTPYRLLTSLSIILLIVLSLFLSYPNQKAMLSVLSASQSYDFRHRQESLVLGFYMPIHKLVYSTKALALNLGSLRILEKSNNNISIESCSFLSRNIILIIGESYNKHHSSLYGYEKKTTPRQQDLAEKGELAVFSDVVTPWNFTCEAFEYILSLYTIGDKGDWYNYPLFTTVIKKSGYNVTFITNEFVPRLNQGIWDFNAGLFLNTKTMSENQFSHRNNALHDFDEGLFNDYDSLKSYNKENNLIIFHLIGQHVNYKQRYPKGWNFFSASDYSNRNDLTPSQKEILADYDNATLYNDYIVCKILDLFRKEDAICIYLPDHGDQCFDNCLFFGRNASMTKNSVYQQFEIPFWIWCSNSYKEKHPKTWSQINQSKDKKMMTDNLGHLLLYLAGISTPFYKPSNNIIAEEYYENRPRLLKEEVDYDALMKKR